ncbi:DUF1638 domain-containing protein [Sporomusa aerivorans]|uniref:DUF1638 domain-containing protein n=1 Tax=Sporomusa aerivorans TaxID=204936 RepID=UPI00352A4BA0
MGTAIIACQTLRDELRLAIKETGVEYPVIYIESGLHNTPELLHKSIQENINCMDNISTILLAFGYCGNSLLGIRSEKARLVIPKVDDCIPLLLGSCEARRNILKEKGTYFLTQGWLDNENNLLREYERCVERYGPERALKIMKIIRGHYKRFMLIDTGAYAVESVLPQTRRFAEMLHMCHEVTKGSLRLLCKLLQEQWDEEFLVLEPGKEVTLQDICANNIQAAMNQSTPVRLISC